MTPFGNVGGKGKKSGSKQMEGTNFFDYTNYFCNRDRTTFRKNVNTFKNNVNIFINTIHALVHALFFIWLCTHVCGFDAPCCFGEEASSESGIVLLFFDLNSDMLTDAYVCAFCTSQLSIFYSEQPLALTISLQEYLRLDMSYVLGTTCCFGEKISN